MLPFRNEPHTIDRVICANCGKAAWDHFISASGADCDGPHTNDICRYFSLTFTPLAEYTIDQRVHHPR
jgi:hypothetical protein